MPRLFISRDLESDSIFKKQLANANIEIISQSLIQFSSLPIDSIPETDWVFFYSKKGVEFFFHSSTTQSFLKKLASQNRTIKWAVIGKGTAKALEKFNTQADFIGKGNPYDTAQAFKNIASGQKVLFARALHSQKSVQSLLSQDVEIFDIVAYKNSSKTNINLPFCKYLVFTSPLNATAYFKKYTFQEGQKLIAIGATTAKSLSELGFSDIVIAETPSESALAKAVLQVMD